MNKLKFGLIGVGNISGKHLNGYAALPDDVEIVAACDLVPERMEAAARAYGIPKLSRDYRELLAMPDLDFVSVCLPNHLHAPVTLEALEAGKHVHCEKPMAMNAAEAESMVAAMRKTGRILMVGLNNRFTAHAAWTRRFVEQGGLGDIYFAKCGWLRRNGLPPTGWFTDRARSGGGALIDLGVHFLDLALYFLGYPEPKTVTARTFRAFGGEPQADLHTFPGHVADPAGVHDVEDLATGFLDLAGGTALSFEISWASHIEREKVFYELYGTRAGLRYEDDMTGKPTLRVFSTLGDRMADTTVIPDPFRDRRDEFRHFVDCIRAGRESDISIPDQNIAMMRLVDTIYRSADTRRQVLCGSGGA